MINQVFLLELGQRVKLKALEVNGSVIAYFYDKNGPQYRVVYWYNGDRKECWMTFDELLKVN